MASLNHNFNQIPDTPRRRVPVMASLNPNFNLISPRGQVEFRQPEEVTNSKQVGKILKMVGLIIGDPFVFDSENTEGEMAEKNSSISDALQAYCKLIVGDIKAIEFLSIVQNLRPPELEYLEEHLKIHYYKKLALLDLDPSLIRDQKVKGWGGDGGFLMKATTQAIAGASAKVVTHLGESIFDVKTSACLEPLGKAALGGGLLLVMAGAVLQEKKPGFAKVMVKFGSVAIASAILVPMAMSLPPLMAWVFGLLAALIVVVTAALA